MKTLSFTNNDQFTYQPFGPLGVPMDLENKN